MLLFGVFYTLTTRRVVTQKVITYYFFILLIENELKRLADAFLTDSHLNFGTEEVLCALFQSVQKNEFFKSFQACLKHAFSKKFNFILSGVVVGLLFSKLTLALVFHKVCSKNH